MDPVWIAAAFVFGFAVRQIGLPPMVGFLAAGFVLQHFGVEQTEVLSDLADFGVTLLLFSIGLKLKLSNLLRREVWGTATSHMGVTVAVLTLGLLALPFGIFGELDLPRALLIAFALSFSSTVFGMGRAGTGAYDCLVARFPDEQAVLEAAGIRYVHDFYADAGAGFADEVWDDLKSTAV